jgi:hypothetical protein
MIPVCIYQNNHGLGPCGGPVCRITVVSKTTVAWRGLHELAERLQATGEAPGVYRAHEDRAEANGYLLGLVAPAPSTRRRRPRTPQSP